MGNRSSNAGVVGIGELDQQEILKEVVDISNFNLNPINIVIPSKGSIVSSGSLH